MNNQYCIYLYAKEDDEIWVSNTVVTVDMIAPTAEDAITMFKVNYPNRDIEHVSYIGEDKFSIYQAHPEDIKKDIKILKEHAIG